MKKIFKSKLIMILLTFAAIFTIAGCTFRESLDEYRESNGLDAQVTYYANGGAFEDNTKVKNIYYKSGQLAFNVGKNQLASGSTKILRDDHEFIGWYQVELDENGQPKLDENGDMILGDEVDFNVPLGKNEHWSVCASWKILPKVKVKLVCEDNEQLEVADGDTTIVYKNGDVIKDYSFVNGEVVSTSKAPATDKNDAYTFYDFYADEACTTAVEWPIKEPEIVDENDVHVYIYAKYIKGSWTFVKTAEDVKSMFSNTTSKYHYYLRNDIDCEGLKISTVSLFNCELQGNGYTISNLEVEKSSANATTKLALFGEIDKNAKIENVNFSDIQITYSTFPDAMINAYLVFTALSKDAVITNVSIDAEVTIKLVGNKAFVANIPVSSDGVANLTKWKFGGYETDAEYIAENSNGFMVTEETTVTIVNHN